MNLSHVLSHGLSRREPALDFATYLETVKEGVDAALASFLRDQSVHAARAGRAPFEAVTEVAKLTLRGGKRQRAALVCAAYEAAGGTGGPEAVVMAGVSLELLQAYFLVQDDWMDASEERRGGPSVHVALRASFGSEHDAAAAAVLAADHACALAQEAMMELPGLPPECIVAALRELARIQREVICGQLLDVSGTAVRPEEVLRMHELKTGSYTVRGPLELGAILAGATTAQHAFFERFSRPLGIAFQLRDDLLGAFGEEIETGKPSQDVANGKRTSLYAELASHEAGREALATHDPGVITRAMIETGAKKSVEDRLAALVEEALGALASAPLSRPGKELLASAASALAWRTR